MCGRYVLIDGKIIFAVSAQLQTWRNEGKDFSLIPRYDARPTALMPVVAQRDNSYQVQMMRWGLVPHWSKDGRTEFSTFNAKAETLHSSKLYAPYFKSARCLVPADGFFEWKKYTVEAIVRGKAKLVEQKQKMFIRMKDHSPFMMAGLFSIWKNVEGEEFPTYTIITTSSNELLSEIHDRMPVILDAKNYEPWLNRGMNDIDFLKTLLVPYPAQKMTVFAVTNSSEESPEMIEKIEFEVPAAPGLMKATKPITSPKKKR
ncbi:MAG: SOS response-associated peptidase [Bacteriovoracaceae bacterium]|nr:SOS response-associated peptidase [Bacteroidota bacterium]